MMRAMATALMLLAFAVPAYGQIAADRPLPGERIGGQAAQRAGQRIDTRLPTRLDSRVTPRTARDPLVAAISQINATRVAACTASDAGGSPGCRRAR